MYAELWFISAVCQTHSFASQLVGVLSVGSANKCHGRRADIISLCKHSVCVRQNKTISEVACSVYSVTVVLCYCYYCIVLCNRYIEQQGLLEGFSRQEGYEH